MTRVSRERPNTMIRKNNESTWVGSVGHKRVLSENLKDYLGPKLGIAFFLPLC